MLSWLNGVQSQMRRLPKRVLGGFRCGRTRRLGGVLMELKRFQRLPAVSEASVQRVLGTLAAPPQGGADRAPRLGDAAGGADSTAGAVAEPGACRSVIAIGRSLTALAPGRAPPGPGRLPLKNDDSLAHQGILRPARAACLLQVLWRGATFRSWSHGFGSPLAISQHPRCRRDPDHLELRRGPARRTGAGWRSLRTASSSDPLAGGDCRARRSLL